VKPTIFLLASVAILQAQVVPRSSAPRERVPPRTPNAAEDRIGAIGGVRIHATDEQRDQVRACNQILERAQTALKSLPVQGSQLREQIATLNQEQEKLIAGLDKNQHEQLRTRISDIERARDHANAALKKLSGELTKSKPDQKRVAELAAEMERETTPWQEQYRGLQADFEP